MISWEVLLGRKIRENDGITGISRGNGCGGYLNWDGLDCRLGLLSEPQITQIALMGYDAPRRFVSIVD